MNDIEVSSIDLVEGGNVFKQGHYLTLGYVPRDEKGETVDLSGKTLNVSLWGRKGVVFEAAATYSDGVIRFTFDKLVAAGDYTVEFTATSSTDAKYRKKFPTNQHSGRIAIKQSADDLGVVGIQVYTVAQLKAEQKLIQDNYEKTVDSKIAELKTSTETRITNIVNGKFDNANGWTAAESTNTVAGNKLINKATGSLNAPSTYAGNRIAGNKYYSRAVVKLLDAGAIELNFIVAGMATPIPNPLVNTAYYLSEVKTAASNGVSAIQVRHTYPDAATAKDKRIEIEKALSVNLTETFGAGKEPTKKQMDDLLAGFPNAWFEGLAKPSETQMAVIRAWFNNSMGGSSGTIDNVDDGKKYEITGRKIENGFFTLIYQEVL